MGSLTETGLTGEGDTLLAGGTLVQVTDLMWNVTSITSVRVREIGSSPPIRLMYAGSIGLGQTWPALDGVSPDKFLSVGEVHLNFVDGDDTRPANNYADSLWWKLPLGVTVDVEVFWT